MQEHRGSATASAAADPCSHRSPTADSSDAAGARAVQAGAALTLFEMAAWRLEGVLADATARARLATALEMELTPRALTAAASHLRWLLSLLCGPAAPAADAPHSPAAACVNLFALLSERLDQLSAAAGLGRGPRAVLRVLASAEGLEASVASLACRLGATPEQAFAALEALAAAGCAVVDRPGAVPDPERARGRLTRLGAQRAEADPLGELVRRAQESLDAEALWRLVQLAAALQRLGAGPTGATEDAPR
jgi:hypothetical protein